MISCPFSSFRARMILKVFLVLFSLHLTLNCQEVAYTRDKEISDLKLQEARLKQSINLLRQTKKSLKEKRRALEEKSGIGSFLLLLPTQVIYQILNFTDVASLIALEGTAWRFKGFIDNYWKEYTETCLKDPLFSSYEPACKDKGFKHSCLILKTMRRAFHILYQSDTLSAKKILNLAFNISSLTTFNVRTKEEGEAIVRALPFNTSITTFSISCSEFLSNDNAEIFFKALQKNQSIQNLSFSLANISPERMAFFKGFISNTLTLQDISLEGVEDMHAQAFASSLAYNKSLVALRLSNNKIGPTGATAIAEALKYNTTLTTLNLGHNPLQEEGAKAFAGTLLCNATLEYLYLHWTKLNLAAVEALAESLINNYRLKHLDITYNEVGSYYRLFNQIKECTNRNYSASKEKS